MYLTVGGLWAVYISVFIIAFIIFYLLFASLSWRYLDTLAALIFASLVACLGIYFTYPFVNYPSLSNSEQSWVWILLAISILVPVVFIIYLISATFRKPKQLEITCDKEKEICKNEEGEKLKVHWEDQAK